MTRNGACRVLIACYYLPHKQEMKAEDAMKEVTLSTVASSPISDRSFIGKTAGKLCADSSIYWTYPVCDVDNNTTG